MGKIRIAYQGEMGAYSESALLQYFGDKVESIPCEEFAKVFELTFSGEADFGFIPVENSTAGSIHQNYDLLNEYDLHIIGEQYYQIHHCLIGLPGTQLDDIKTVISHPQALAQSAVFLHENHIKAQASFDTAGSVRLIKEGGDPSMGAIASAYACKVHDMALLSENIETSQNNTTRFLAIRKAPAALADGDKKYKATYIFTLPHYPGALSKVLSGIAERSFNLTKIESRPLQNKPWEYIFCIDVSAELPPTSYDGLQEYLFSETNSSKLVGIYPASKNPLVD
ncbi:MAG: prephenate dehydratase [Anaerolineaceae bacterium]|nr:prephenate dehydratase [Anaerolineaceae bacterium]